VLFVSFSQERFVLSYKHPQFLINPDNAQLEKSTYAAPNITAKKSKANTTKGELSLGTNLD